MGTSLAVIVGISMILASDCQAGRRDHLAREVATPETPAVSPSGKYTLDVLSHEEEGGRRQSFRILDRNGVILYASPDWFSVRHTTFFLWDGADRVWVSSGDLGTFFWENTGEPREWEKRVYAQSHVPAPPFLKEVRPRWHQR